MSEQSTSNADNTDSTSRISNSQQKEQDILQKGIIFHQSGQTDEAIYWYRKALEINPENTIAHSNIGAALQSTGQLEEAARSYQKAIDSNPDYAEAHNNIGTVLQEQSKLDSAVASYKKAIDIKPDYVEVYSNLGNALKEQGKLCEAVTYYQKAISIKPNYAEAYYNLGNTQQEQGKPDTAVTSYQKAINIKPNFAEAYYNIGFTLQGQGQLEAAVASYKKAIDIKPDYIQAMYSLQTIFSDTDLRAAIKCLENAARHAPNDIKTKFFLGMLTEFHTGEEFFIDEYSYDNKISSFFDSWQHIKSQGEPYPTLFGTTTKGLHLGLNHAHIDGLILEFGVRYGATIRQIATFVKQEVHGFDSFQGLPESWHNKPKGSYSTHGELPIVPKNVSLHPGLFEETLPVFLEEHSGPVKFLNVDCDLYSSTKTVLSLLADRIVKGTVIVFDEYLTNDSWREDEFKAFQESVASFGWQYEYLAFSIQSKQVVVIIK
jgi:tetratricopeptide (TPR) repeat protein